MTVAIGTQHLRDPAVLRAARFDLVATADAYGNEALVGEALSPGTRVVAKGGLVQPGWRPDGRARHLAAAARASLANLGRIDVYLLHAVDPKVPFATSVRALDRLRREGVVGAIGLSNINATQLAEALAIAPIAMIEIELSPWKLDAIRSGLVAKALAHGVEVLAYRPFGGAKNHKRVLRDFGDHATVLAWLRSLGVTPLPGPTRVETALACAAPIELSPARIAELSAQFLGEALSPFTSSQEAVIVMGMPGSGKTTLAKTLDGVRLNRDERGGTLAMLADELDAALEAGAERVVLDNTYGTRTQRALVVQTAKRHGASVRCIEVTTSLEDAQRNAAQRILDKHGHFPDPLGDEVPPLAQFRYRRTYEPPSLDEGFDALEQHAFTRAPTAGVAGVIVELDNFVWSRADLTPRPEALAQIAAWRADGLVVAGTTWMTPASARAQLDFPVACCPHPAGPPVCWCRKPLPGLGLLLARQLNLDLAQTIVVGSTPHDRGFAERLGARFQLTV